MQFYISHRGNLYGPNPERENDPIYINEALYAGFHCEIDVWYINDNFFLGHDKPQYPIEKDFLEDPRLWCHAKNVDAFIEMISNVNIVSFWHEHDRYALTSDGYIWTWNFTEHNDKCIIIHPELMLRFVDYNNIAGVCSDYIGSYKK